MNILCDTYLDKMILRLAIELISPIMSPTVASTESVIWSSVNGFQFLNWINPVRVKDDNDKIELQRWSMMEVVGEMEEHHCYLHTRKVLKVKMKAIPGYSSSFLFLFFLLFPILCLLYLNVSLSNQQLLDYSLTYSLSLSH